jgi:hypothetical protein
VSFLARAEIQPDTAETRADTLGTLFPGEAFKEKELANAVAVQSVYDRIESPKHLISNRAYSSLRNLNRTQH